DRPVLQVVGTLVPPPRAGSLAVCRPEMFMGREMPSVKELAGVILIKQAGSDGPSSATSAVSTGGTAVPTNVTPALNSVDVLIKRITKLCKDEEVPLLMVPGFGEPGQIADDIRMAFLKEVKQISSRLHSFLLSVLLDSGIEGLVDEVSERLNRPVVVESADFKVLASRNMGATPAAQQHALTDEAFAQLRRRTNAQKSYNSQIDFFITPVKIGRRLVLPVILGEAVVGYVSVMVRPNDDTELVGEYLQSAALAAMVDFSQRSRDGSIFAVTQKSLLKDLLSGNSLSASDQERIERHYGFDLCDGLLVFAVEANTSTVLGAHARPVPVPEDGMATTEVEGTRVYIFPYSAKQDATWQEQAANLVKQLKEFNATGDEIRVQVGAARLAQTILDLPDAYREARQALIIGSMIHGENEFVIGYGDLGIKRLLYLMIDHPELDRFLEENLAPLEEYDEEWESELVPTLKVYLEQGANLNSTARALFIHRHTLRYRLEQIADILKVDIDSQEVLLNLQIAFLIREMKGEAKGKGRA
ncbi:MAG TPA: helix-turn-helix domain-containing protein, partial [Chroococcales cyanobacterium]